MKWDTATATDLPFKKQMRSLSLSLSPSLPLSLAFSVSVSLSHSLLVFPHTFLNRTSQSMTPYLGHFSWEFPFVISNFAHKSLVWVWEGQGSVLCSPGLVPQAARLPLNTTAFLCHYSQTAAELRHWSSPLFFLSFSLPPPNFVIEAINFILVKEGRMEDPAWVIQQHSWVFGVPVTTPQFVQTCP